MDDPQIRLLVDRLTSWSADAQVRVASEIPAAGTVVLLNAADAGIPAPERPEGYALSVQTADGRDLVAINGYDRLGRLWGIVSMLQLVRREDGGMAMRGAEIVDWPDHPARGCLTNEFRGGSENAEAIMLYTKANTIVFQIRPPQGYAYWQNFVNDGPQKIGPAIQRLAPLFSGLGLNVYFSINPAAGQPKLTTSEKDFEMLVDWMSQVAALDAGVYWAYDDVRFPVPPEDLEKFGSAAEADAYLVPKVFKAVRAKYPDFRLVFCPPFYWGPTTPHPYPEDRETYLRRIGEEFDPGIDVFWTGPRVQSSVITRDEVAWFTQLIGRKPWLFQNRGWLPNKYDSSHVTDRITAWRDWRYDGFWSDMAAPLLNLHADQNLMSLASISDFLWNTGDYDAERSVRAAAGLYYGPEAFPFLDRMNRALSYFNQYQSVTPAAARNLAEIVLKLDELQEAWETLLREIPDSDAISHLTVFASRVGFAERFVNSVKQAAAKGFAQFDEWDRDVRALAVDEAQLRDGDILITPSAITGGNGYIIYSTRCEPRFGVWINGRQSPNPEMRTRFTCEPFPPQGDYTMIINGQEDAQEGKSCNIRISVNDVTIHEGPSGFPRHGWARRVFTLPAEALQRNNTLTFTNLDDGTSRAPWFMINYIILRP